ncbi:response regulator receiver domain-containing protein [Breoghania corrubedonensis]|uniref:Response regulator receiver domain-containing protein n=1 Tax=Breoghania corrubedonensis TaxID=665038 RepID=A0A2T5V6V5_9HYPH|nr:response regulator [Breoghania corrubedonensis]PTW59456.1 response regulator receiver domain-containing protein [Breoghania corrubedonensis]
MALSDPFEDGGLGEVLIIDPQDFGSRLMKVMVEDLGCPSAMTADTVADALASLVASDIDLVIVDRRFGMSSIARLLKALRQASDPRFQNITVLLSTDAADRAFVDAIGLIGVDGIVVTPCSARILGERIGAARGIWHRHFASPPRPRAAYGKLAPEREITPTRPTPLPSR